MKICEIENCCEPVQAKRLCSKHYHRLIRTGSVELLKQSNLDCSIDGCQNKSYSKGMCRNHYDNLRRKKSIKVKTLKKVLDCSMPDCHKPQVGLGLCMKHYKQKKRTGQETRINETLFEKVLKRVEEGGDSCFESVSGNLYYPSMFVNGKSQLIHRFVCEMTHGPAPEDKPISRHLCGNGHIGCFNPKHLVWGNQKENALDRDRHERTLKGENSPSAKLTTDQVEWIKAENLSNYKSLNNFCIIIAEKFNVTYNTIYNIRKGISWI